MKDKMTKDLLKKLADKKFGGKVPNFRKARFDQVEVACAEDKENWYMIYSSGGLIIVQDKAGKGVPHCYECGGEVYHKTQHRSVWFEEFHGPVGGGEVRSKRIPYCPQCGKEPEATGVIIESVEESLGR